MKRPFTDEIGEEFYCGTIRDELPFVEYDNQIEIRDEKEECSLPDHEALIIFTQEIDKEYITDIMVYLYWFQTCRFQWKKYETRQPCQILDHIVEKGIYYKTNMPLSLSSYYARNFSLLTKYRDYMLFNTHLEYIMMTLNQQFVELVERFEFEKTIENQIELCNLNKFASIVTKKKKDKFSPYFVEILAHCTERIRRLYGWNVFIWCDGPLSPCFDAWYISDQDFNPGNHRLCANLSTVKK